MSILSALRDRFSNRESSAGESADEQDAQGKVAEARPPFAGYDRLDQGQVIDELADHSQIELEAVEGYERSHKRREAVLDKLHWMRGPEPIPGYDALSVEEIVAALADADLATVKKVRAYERKFAHRRDVLEEVARVNHRLQASQPASAAPAYKPTSYEPTSAPSVAAPRDDRREKSGGP
jgi:hypothetical protein